MFLQRPNQVFGLYITERRPPHDSQWNTQPGISVNFGVAGSFGPQLEGGAAAEWMFISVSCRGLLPCKAIPALSCFHIRHALCNLPASYEHEVNKALGHHKSQANDMSSPRLDKQSRVVELRAGQPASCPAASQLILSSEVPMCKIIIKIAAQLR